MKNTKNWLIALILMLIAIAGIAFVYAKPELFQGRFSGMQLEMGE
jgi:hypothetical protein